MQNYNLLANLPNSLQNNFKRHFLLKKDEYDCWVNQLTRRRLLFSNQLFHFALVKTVGYSKLYVASHVLAVESHFV